MNPIKHVAIIMDGNGRWGIKHKKSRNLGHRAGLYIVEKIIKETIRRKIKFLSLFAFSTENWKRPKKEVYFLFNLLEEFLIKKIDEFKKNGIKLKIIGNKKKFPLKIKKILTSSEQKTKKNRKLHINLALNYGSKNEIVNTVNFLKNNNISMTENKINMNLYTKNIPDPEILIRTGDTRRLSNFMLWQIAYSEIYFEKKMWPDFTAKDYNRIIKNFKKVKRNFGNI